MSGGEPGSQGGGEGGRVDGEEVPLQVARTYEDLGGETHL